MLCDKNKSFNEWDSGGGLKIVMTNLFIYLSTHNIFKQVFIHRFSALLMTGPDRLVHENMLTASLETLNSMTQPIS